MFFRKMVFVGSALLMSGGLAMSADLPEMGYVEPMEPVPLPPSGFYASLHAGYVMLGDVEGDAGTDSAESHVEDGYRVGGAFGYDFNSMIGIEAELSYFENDIDSLSTAGTTFQASGDVGVLTLMGNVIIGHQFDRWRPYVGVGAGAAHADFDFDIIGIDSIDDSNWGFAAQAFAGLDFSMTDTVSLGARYRYAHIGSIDYTSDGGLDISGDAFGAHSIEAALKVKFGG